MKRTSFTQFDEIQDCSRAIQSLKDEVLELKQMLIDMAKNGDNKTK